MKEKPTLNFKNIFFYVIFPLSIGGIIYILSRSNNIFFLKYLNLENNKININDWIKYNLVDGIWSFSLTMFILLIWNFEINKNSLFWLIFIIFLSLTFEICFGTFDINDLLFLFIGIITPFLIFRKKIFQSKQ